VPKSTKQNKGNISFKTVVSQKTKLVYQTPILNFPYVFRSKQSTLPGRLAQDLLEPLTEEMPDALVLCPDQVGFGLSRRPWHQLARVGARNNDVLYS
jgi:hypothetical protein